MTDTFCETARLGTAFDMGVFPSPLLGLVSGFAENQVVNVEASLPSPAPCGFSRSVGDGVVLGSDLLAMLEGAESKDRGESGAAQLELDFHEPGGLVSVVDPEDLHTPLLGFERSSDVGVESNGLPTLSPPTCFTRCPGTELPAIPEQEAFCDEHDVFFSSSRSASVGLSRAPGERNGTKGTTLTTDSAPWPLALPPATVVDTKEETARLLGIGSTTGLSSSLQTPLLDSHSLSEWSADSAIVSAESGHSPHENVLRGDVQKSPPLSYVVAPMQPIDEMQKFEYNSVSSLASNQIRLLAQSKEWGAIGDSSAHSIEVGPSQNSPFLMDTRRRYRKRSLNIDDRTVLHPPTPPVNDSSLKLCVDQHVVRCWTWLLYFVDIWLNSFFILLALRKHRWIIAACLAPPQLFLLFFQTYLARRDWGMRRYRKRLRMTTKFGDVWFNLVVVVLMGICSWFPLMRARRCWLQRGLNVDIIEEIEAQSRSDSGAAHDSVGARFDSHVTFITAVPRLVVLGHFLVNTPCTALEFCAACTLMSLALLSVVQAVVYFDYFASRWVRQQHNSYHTVRFNICHYGYRTSEITGRAWIFVAITVAFRWSSFLGFFMLLVDYCFGFVALLLVTGFYPGSLKMILVLSVPLYVSDVCLFIDEHGVTRQANSVSRWFYWIRTLESALTMFLFTFYAFCPDTVGPLTQTGATIFLLLNVCAHVASFTVRRFTQMSYTGVDIFSASEQNNVTLILEYLAAGCDVNLVALDTSHETPLHAAARFGAAGSARILLMHGADPLLLDGRGDTPLHHACRSGNAEVIEMLVRPDISWPCGARGDIHKSMVCLNYQLQTPIHVLQDGAPAYVALMLAEAQQQAQLNFSPLMTRTSSLGRKPTFGAELAQTSQKVFGPRIRRRESRFMVAEPAAGKGRASSESGLTSLMFSSGVGEQLEEALSERQPVQLSSLRTQEVLGAGSFGKVFKVVDIFTNEVYALKLQRRDRTTKFAVREAQTLHKSCHAFIVHLVHIFQTQTYYALLMELCHENLNVCILRHKNADGRSEGLPPDLAARYIACVALALEFLHHAHILFRDLKPENILITSKEKGNFAKLTDFGLARSLDLGESLADAEDLRSASKQGHVYASAICGTPRFMAPECFEECVPVIESTEERLRRLSSRDWYGLGCCLLLCLLGEDGGTRITSGGREVLLPPAQQQEYWPVLLNAVEVNRISDAAFQLVAALTAPIGERAGVDEVLFSPFLQQAIADTEPEVLRYEREVLGMNHEVAPRARQRGEHRHGSLKMKRNNSF